MIESLSELTPAARAAAEQLLDASVARLRGDLRASVREDLLADLCESLSAEATVTDIAAQVIGFAAVGDEADGSSLADLFERLAAGARLQGVGQRIAQSWWNPADQRLFAPRAVGWGWDLNFAAVAVRLGLIEPDAETVPFSATPERAFQLAAAVPVAMAAAVVAHYVVRGRSLPGQLPSHWDLVGTPDRWVPKARAAATDLAVSGAAAGLAGWAATTSRPGPERAGALAAATLGGVLGAGTTLIRGLARPRGWVSPAVVAAASAAVGAVLYGLARSGRDAEILRDLGPHS